MFACMNDIKQARTYVKTIKSYLEKHAKHSYRNTTTIVIKHLYSHLTFLINLVVSLLSLLIGMIACLNIYILFFSHFTVFSDSWFEGGGLFHPEN